MATRALIRVLDEDDDGGLHPRLKVYNHWDGYPAVTGLTLARILRRNEGTEPSLLVMRMLLGLAGEQFGQSNVYVESPLIEDYGQEYEYHLVTPRPDRRHWHITCYAIDFDGNDQVVYEGDLDGFERFCIGEAEQLDEAYRQMTLEEQA